MSDTCAAAPAKKPQLIEAIVARDKVVYYLDHNVRASIMLAARIHDQGKRYAYAQAVRDCLPDLIHGLEDDVADAVERVMRSRLPRMVKQVRRARGAA